MRLQQCRAFHHQKDQKSAAFPPQLSSSLIQRGGRVGQLNGPRLPFTRPCQRDKAQVDFWVLIVLSEVTKRNLSASNLRVALTSPSLPPSLYPSIARGDSDNRGPLSLDMQQSSAIDWHQELLFSLFLPPNPCNPLLLLRIRTPGGQMRTFGQLPLRPCAY